jgi:hypothetical protein
MVNPTSNGGDRLGYTQFHVLREILGSTEPGSADHLTRCVMEGWRGQSGQAFEEKKSPIEKITWVFYNDMCNFGCVEAL